MRRSVASAVLERLQIWAWNNWVLIAIMALAAFFRLFRIDEVPLGISHDEAGNALMALEVLQGRHAVFFEINKGIEPLMVYLQAGATALLGTGPLALRLPAALVGVATVFCTYLLIRLMFTKRVAVFSALALAITFWPIFVSRIGLRAATLPLVETLAFYFLWRGLKKGGRANYALAGLFLGGSLYTYISARFVPLVALVFLVYLAIRMPSHRTRSLYGRMALLLGLAVVTAAPIGLYFWSHPSSFTLRAGQVNDLRFITENHDFGPLLVDSLNTIGMFVVRGDPSSRYNLAGRPVFDPLSSAVFVIGLLSIGRSIRTARRSSTKTKDPDTIGRTFFGEMPKSLPEVFILVWLVVMLLPSAMTGESPHFWRAVGAIPPAFALLGIGADACWRTVEARRRRLARFALPLATALILGFSAVTTYRDYFDGWAGDLEAREIYRADLAELAQLAEKWDGQGRLMVSAEYPYDLDPIVLKVLRGGKETIATWFDGSQTLVLPAGEKTSAYYFFPSFARPPKTELNRYFGPAPGIEESPHMLRLEAGAPFLPAPGHRSGMRFGGLEIMGYEIAGDGKLEAGSQVGQPAAPAYAAEKLSMIIYWRVLEKPEEGARLTFFAHLIGNMGRMWSQSDMSPFPEESWQVGDVIVNRHDIEIPSGTPPNLYALEAGVFSRNLGERLQTDEGKDRLRVDSIRILAPAKMPEADDLSVANRLEVDFEDNVSLSGYDLTPPVLKAGESVELTIFWLPRGTVGKSYKVFNHLLDSEEGMVTQKDGEPADGFYPTDRWKSGELVRDKFTIVLPADTPPGRYRVATGLYAPESGARLRVLGPKSRLPQKLQDLMDWLLVRREKVGDDRLLLRPIVVKGR